MDYGKNSDSLIKDDLSVFDIPLMKYVASHSLHPLLHENTLLTFWYFAQFL